MAHETSSQPGLVDPVALARVRSLELRARLAVEGLRRGLHRSLRRGFSVEFSEHRPLAHGEDTRFLDFRLLARTDRAYQRTYEDETHLRCTFVLDGSRSMAYGSGDLSKSAYGATLVATLATFLASQGDAVGLATLSDRLHEHLPARHRPGHLRRLFAMLERAPDGGDTVLGPPLFGLARVLRRRGLVVVVSDLFAPVDGLDVALRSLTARGHAVALFEVRDPVELKLEHPSLAAPLWLRDLESGRRLHIDPAAAREAYLRRLAEHDARVRVALRGANVVHIATATDAPLDGVLLRFLAEQPLDRRARRMA